MSPHYHPIHCIIPPHMVDEIVKNGEGSQVERALKTLEVSGQIRDMRETLAAASRKSAGAAGAKQRLIYDAENGSSLPGTLVRSEGEPSNGDVAVDEAYDGSGATYDLYFDIFERNSIDNNGMELVSVVHYLKGYDNAFWNGERMVYGDGDEDLPVANRLFNRFTIAIDIIAHELTHGVTQYEANLVYKNQPGALNESFSDVFGSLVKQRVKNQTAAQADWLIGEGLFTTKVNAQGIRSMKDPGTAYNDPLIGKDPQPGHMNDYVQTTSDNGGVHINSGIPNKAFYNAAIALGGYAWEKAGKIWYRTRRDKLTANSDFMTAANATVEVAGSLYGANSTEQKAVQKAWEDVGIVFNLDQKKGCANVFTGLLAASGL
jgi:Zn-dependent metalloprotease